MLNDTEKLMRLGMIFNALVALMNLGFFVSKILDGNYWGSAFTLFLVGLNTWCTIFMYNNLVKYQQQQKQRVADILTGKYDDANVWCHDG